MLDPHLLRNHLEQVEEQLTRRSVTLDSSRFRDLDSQRKAVQVETQSLQNERNRRSKGIGKAKAMGEDIQPLLAEVQDLGDRLKEAESRLSEIQAELEAFMLDIPNLLDDAVPFGKSEADNLEISRWGEIPEWSFAPKDHVDLGVPLGGMNFEAAAKIAGSRFVTLNGPLARLQRALIQFMLDLHTGEHGYLETYVPFMVNADSLRGTGQLPKFEKDLFTVQNDPPVYLIPTADVPVTNLVKGEIIETDSLPLRYVAHTPSFRSEAGSYGKDVRGMIR